MIQIPSPDDFHVHLREGPALPRYVADHALLFNRALIMPNTLPPVVGLADILRYKESLLSAARSVNPDWLPLMTFKIVGPQAILRAHNNTDWNQIARNLADAGVIAGKLYPAGTTTNSSDGVTELEELFPLFAAMEKAGLVLCVHGEDPDAFCMDREAAWLPRMKAVVGAFPNLKIVIEHVSSEQAVTWIRAQSANVAATVTVHHLLFTLDDMIGTNLQPHLYCKPMLKRPEDRDAIQQAVLECHPRFFFGSDSAPHARAAKECECGAAGVYSASVALPLLAAFFNDRDKISALGDFVGTFGARFYGLNATTKTITLTKEAWKVPNILHPDLPGGGVVPLYAGKVLEWKVV